MIFLGDLACPLGKIEAFNAAVEAIDALSDETIVVNLEAVISSDLKFKAETLFNHEAVLDGMQRKAKKLIVSLANNHMYDYPAAILPTKNYLESKGIGVFGLCESDGETRPYEFEDSSGTYALFGHCWNLYTTTNPNHINDAKIVDCEYDHFVEQVKLYIQSHSNRKVYCFMHWNYDLEKLPFPMHVRLSRDLIDAGVEGVIGSHSHVVHGVELYKDKPIAYCLGNFYLPSGEYFDGKLIYPEESKKTIGIRINGDHVDILNFDTDRDKPVQYIGKYELTEKTSFKPSDIHLYVKYFKRNRAKRFFVPIFNNYSGIGYRMKLQWAINRIIVIKQLIKITQR